MLRFDKLTLKAQQALQDAQEVAASRQHQQIEPAHILAVLLAQQDGVVAPVLAKLGVRAEILHSDLEQAFGRLPRVTGLTQQQLSRTSSEMLKSAFDEGERFRDEYVSTEHLLLAITALEQDPSAQILRRHGASYDAVLQALTAIRGSQRVTSQNPEATYRAIEQYARDLTEAARRGIEVFSDRSASGKAAVDTSA